MASTVNMENVTVKTHRVTADVVVIGAGLAGLICAQRLQQSGLEVIVVEKSRGLGGRMATRRLPQGHADHGVRCLEVQGELTQQLIARFSAQQILQPWLETVHLFDRTGLHPAHPQPRYSSNSGITAVAKTLGAGLNIWRGQRVRAIIPTPDHRWDLILDGDAATPALSANALVITIPAPQVLPLLEPLLQQGLVLELGEKIRSVQYQPCITVIASYSTEYQPIAVSSPWQAVRFLYDPELDWVAIDSSKQPAAQSPALIVQSTAQFANSYLEAADLQKVGQRLLERASEALAPWLGSPEILQVHRWRYAFVSQPLPADCISASSPLPIVCGGDWCNGREKQENKDWIFSDRSNFGDPGRLGVEVALRSGLAVAEQMKLLLQARSLANANVNALFAEPRFPEGDLTPVILSETIDGLW